MSSEGYVRTNCAYCNAANRVKVTFPSYRKGFRPTTFTCKACGNINELFDPHIYNSKGEIIDG